MSLSQSQIIRSLGEHLSHFERELEWGVNAGELIHLTSRIGELYAAMITRGQMALATNQRGYDVVSAAGERISVKTITTSSHVSFNKNTMDQVDRIILLRLNVEEGEVSVEELLDAAASEVPLNDHGNKLTYSIRRGDRPRPQLDSIAKAASATYDDYQIEQYENGTITVSKDGLVEPNTKSALRGIAEALGVSLLNGNGNPMNTRSLGAAILAALTRAE